MNENRALALRLAEYGAAVFPCVPYPDKARNGKAPLTPNGKDDASADSAAIKRFWDEHPSALVGIVPGSFGAVVIDADRKPGKPDGVANLAALGIDISAAPVIETPNSGLHYWLAKPSGARFKNSTGSLPDGVDIRGDNGYACLGTCLDGETYGGAEHLFHALDNGGLPEIPAELVTLINTPKKSISQRAAPAAPATFSGDASHPYAQAALDNAVAELAAAQSGRSDCLNAKAYSLGRCIGADMLDYETVEAALWDASVRCGLVADYGKRDVIDNIQRATAEGTKQPVESDSCAKSALSAESLRSRWQAGFSGGSHIIAGSAESAGSPKWPDPLHEDAFYGLAGEVVNAIAPNTEADPAAILFQLLAAVGNMCKRSACAYVGHVKHPPQLWPVTVGETSRARKGTSWAAVLQILTKVDDAYWTSRCVTSGLSSGEGLIWAVRDAVVKRQKNKETGNVEEVEEDPGVHDKRLYVQEAEFSQALKQFERSGNTLSPTLRTLFDTGSASPMTKHSVTKTTGAMVTLAPHVTLEELRKLLSETEMANGLANRFMFILVKRAQLLPFGGDDLADEVASDFAERICQHVTAAWSRQGGAGKQHWTDAARKVWREFYKSVAEKDRPGLLGAVTARAEAHTIRLALTYALLDGSHYFEEAHIRAAIACWRYAEQSAAHIFGDQTGDQTADTIIAALRQREDGMTRKEIATELFGNHGYKRIGAALSMLSNAGLICSEKAETGGRPAERWFAA